MRAPRRPRSWKSSFPTAHLSFDESWQAYNITMIQKLLTVPRYVVRHENELFDEAGEEVEVPHQPRAISYSALPLYCDGRLCSVLDHHHYYASRSAAAISANTIKLRHLRPSAFTLPASTPSVAASMLKPKSHSRCPLATMATTSLHSQYVTPSVASDGHCLQVSAYCVRLCGRHRLIFSMELC